MAATKTTQAVQTLEDHTDHTRPCHLANTLALISIALAPHARKPNRPPPHPLAHPARPDPTPSTTGAARV